MESDSGSDERDRGPLRTATVGKFDWDAWHRGSGHDRASDRVLYGPTARNSGPTVDQSSTNDLLRLDLSI